jgi:hypothetical protein
MVELDGLLVPKALKWPLPLLTKTKLKRLVFNQKVEPIQVHRYKYYLHMIYNVDRWVWYSYT